MKKLLLSLLICASVVQASDVVLWPKSLKFTVPRANGMLNWIAARFSIGTR